MAMVGLVLMMVWMHQASGLSLLDQPITCSSGPVNLTLVALYDNCFILGLGVSCPPNIYFSQLLADCYWCYPIYDCFVIGGPFISTAHPSSLPPQSPDQTNVHMDLYTKTNINQPTIFQPNDITNIELSFDPSLDTKFFIGGFQNGDFVPFDSYLRQALFAYGDYNIFVVNWLNASDAVVLGYMTATANARMVGAQLANFIRKLAAKFSYQLSRIHLIGHSLGAQVAGYAGERFTNPQLGRISGLDPAGPWFTNADKKVRLDPSDAAFVDVIHSNAGGLGTSQKCGHLDFFPNGGTVQLSCVSPDNLTPSSASSIATCQHTQAVWFYINSISQCPYLSVQCSSYLGIGLCSMSSKQSDYALMGFHSDEYSDSTPTHNPFFLTTTLDFPFC